MRQYLLDTNILSHLIKQPQSTLTQKILALESDSLCTSIIVACELHYGVEKKGSAQLAAKVELLLNEIDILPLEISAIQHYAALRALLEKQGQVIGSNDMLIAAHALALDVTLITANIDEFNRVPNLRVENWLECQ
jgi:tRNA(fMet)-specific endonuclease VapC